MLQRTSTSDIWRRDLLQDAAMTDLRLDSVTCRFGDAVAVDGIDLVVAQGELVTLLGPSGCGKTTTLRMIAGLERSDGGRIVLGDRVVDDAAKGLFVAPERRDIGMVFQSYAIWPHMTVFDNVAYPLAVRRRPKDEIRLLVMKALRTVGLENFAQRPAPALSGGQQQRVAIARAIVFEPKLLLMDEPLSNLDARLRESMQLELRTLQQRLRITTVYVTHDQGEAMALSDRIVVMGAGRILQQGRPDDVYLKPSSRTVANFLGSPNFLRAVVTSCRSEPGEASVLELERPGWRGTARAALTFLPGQEVTLVVRPEAIRLAPAGMQAEAEWTGEILQSSFRGARRTLVLRSRDDVLQVDADSQLDFAVGERVAISLESSSLWAVALETLMQHEIHGDTW
jgi:iron(III) transport system ATP-binding protein